MQHLRRKKKEKKERRLRASLLSLSGSNFYFHFISSEKKILFPPKKGLRKKAVGGSGVLRPREKIGKENEKKERKSFFLESQNKKKDNLPSLSRRHMWLCHWLGRFLENSPSPPQPPFCRNFFSLGKERKKERN